MAHFAELDENNVVLRVVVISNDDIKDQFGVEQELLGQTWCKILFGPDTRWMQTSYNASIRKNYAGIGYTYSHNLDAFIPPQPYESWVLNEEACQWEPPTSYPSDGESYIWDEQTKSWVIKPKV